MTRSSVDSYTDIRALHPVWVGLGIASMLSVYFVQGLRWKSILAPVAKLGVLAGDPRRVCRTFRQRSLSESGRGRLSAATWWAGGRNFLSLYHLRVC